MKFTITVIEITEKKIEVEAKDYEALRKVLEMAHDDAGIIISEPKTEELLCEIKDENNKEYPLIKLI